MLKYFLFLAIAANLVVFSVSTCNKDESTVSANAAQSYLSENGYSDEEIKIMTNLTDALIGITMTRCFQIGMMHPTSNRVTSLVPLTIAGGMATMVETGDLLEENLAMLHLENVDQVKTAIPIVQKLVNAETEYGKFVLKMQVFGDSSNPFSATFTDQNLEYCAVTSGYVNYSDPTGAAATMNEYTKSVTGYETSDIISEYVFSKTPGAILLGSTSIKTYWGSDVTVADAGNKDFNVVDLEGGASTISVPYIKISGPLRVGTYEGATIISVPLLGNRELITITNAKSGFSFLNLIYKLSDTKKFSDIVFQGETQNAHLYLPNINHLTGREHYAAAWKLGGGSHDLLVPNDCNVCEGVFDGSTECSYLHTFTLNLEWTITSQSAETCERRRRDTTDAESTDIEPSASSSDSDSDWPEYTMDNAFLTMMMCPLKTPQFAYLYLGNQ